MTTPTATASRTRDLVLTVAGVVIVAATYLYLVLARPAEVADSATSQARSPSSVRQGCGASASSVVTSPKRAGLSQRITAHYPRCCLRFAGPVPAPPLNIGSGEPLRG